MYSTPLLQPFIPFLEAFYGRKGKLAYRTPLGDTMDIPSAEGTHQGDVWSPCLFAATLHPEVCACVDSFPDVFALLWADNVFLLGPLQDCARVAASLQQRLPSVGLELNDEESMAFVRAWAGRPEPETPWSNLCEAVDDVCIRYTPAGLKVVGVPVGCPDYVTKLLDATCDKVEAELRKISIVKDGLVFLQLLRFCENTRFDHILGALPPHMCARHARRFDKAILQALEAYCDLPTMVDAADVPFFNVARHCFRDPTASGGLGLTAAAPKAAPAFYAASAHSLRFIHSIPSLRKALLSLPPPDASNPSMPQLDPRSLSCCLASEFADVQEELLQNGCVLQLRSSQPLIGVRPVLPCFPAILGMEYAPEGSLHPIPPQKLLTKTYVPALRRSVSPVMSDTQTYLKAQRSSVELGDHQKSHILDWLGIPKTDYRSFKLSYSPMSFLASRPCTAYHKFSRGEFSLWLRSYFGLPFDNGENTGFCAGFGNAFHDASPCKDKVDRWGHHLHTCGHIGNKDGCWTRSHDYVLSAFHSILSQTDWNATTYVPQHNHDDGKKGDLWIREPIAGCRKGVVGDFTLTHPFVGTASKSAPLGKVKAKALSVAAGSKHTKHAPAYEALNVRFIPLVATSYGEINDEMIRLVWAIARRAAAARFAELDANILGAKSQDRKGQIYTQMRGVIAAAVAHASIARIIHSPVLDGCDKPHPKGRAKKRPEYNLVDAMSTQTRGEC